MNSLVALFLIVPLLSVLAQDEPSSGCFLKADGEEFYYQYCDLDVRGTGYQVFYSINDDDVDIAFRAMWDGWVAFGFTAGDQKMIGSNVVLGWSADEFSCVDDYKLNEKLPTGVNPEHNQDLTSQFVSNENGYTTVRFSRKATTPMMKTAISVTSFTQSIMAIGPLPQMPDGEDPCMGVTIKAHDHEDLTTHFVANVNFASGAPVSLVPGAYDDMIYIHEVFMSISWGILVPLSIVIARFFKPKCKPMWFYLHRALNTTAILLTVVGFILGAFVFGSHIFRTHLAFGIIVLILAVQQPLNALFRPHKRGGITKARHMWEMWHMWSGRICLGFALANVAIGMTIGLITITYVYILWLTFAVIFAFYVYCEITKYGAPPKADPSTAATDKGNTDFRAAFDLTLDDFDQSQQYMAVGNKMRAETA